MPDQRTLGGIDLRDVSAYRIPVASESEDPIYEAVMEGVRGGTTINVGRDDMVARQFTFDVWCTGSTWAAVNNNYDAIWTVVRGAWQAYPGASPVLYTEQDEDQSALTFKVARGECNEVRARRSVRLRRKVLHVILVCEPEPL